MRLNEIFEPVLDEVNMSPGALADFAKTPLAQAMTAGFEAELVIPNAQSDDDGEMEPDYDEDIRCSSTQQIRDFFEGDYNGRRSVDRAIEEIDEKFYEYADEKIMEEFENEEVEMITQILKDNGKTPEEIEEIMGVEDKRYNRDYQNAYDQAYEEFRDGAEYDQYTRRFFRDNFPLMSDVASETGLDWPHWTNSGGGDGESSESIADDIAQSIGMDVKASSGYHGMKRGTGFFILEPDSSIDSEDGEAGLELVSPPLPLSQCLEYLDKVFRWANERGCSTNASTGFHMGISIPDQTRENVDHLKFTMFLGDDYVLQQFGRESNTYAKSMVQQMSQKLRNLNAGSGNMSAESILGTFKDGLNSSAANFIKKSLTTTHDRYVTVNIKDKYIEVRSAGGDYLDDLPKIKNTLLRYVRAMSLAADPEAEKQEYAKKLYKFLSPMVRGDDDIIKYFTQYSSGTLPATALKSFLRHAQQKRTNKKTDGAKIDTPGVLGDGPNLYKVQLDNVHTNFADDVNVRAGSHREVVDIIRQQYPESAWNIYKIIDVEVTDNTAARAQAQQNTAANTYRMTDSTGGYLSTISNAANPMAATLEAIRRANAAGLTQGTWRLMAPGGRQLFPDPSATIDNIPEIPGEFVDDPMAANRSATAGTYIITYLSPSGGEHRTAYDANSAREAEELFISNHPRTYQIVNTAIA